MTTAEDPREPRARPTRTERETACATRRVALDRLRERGSGAARSAQEARAAAFRASFVDDRQARVQAVRHAQDAASEARLRALVPSQRQGGDHK